MLKTGRMFIDYSASIAPKTPTKRPAPPCTKVLPAPALEEALAVEEPEAEEPEPVPVAVVEPVFEPVFEPAVAVAFVALLLAMLAAKLVAALTALDAADKALVTLTIGPGPRERPEVTALDAAAPEEAAEEVMAGEEAAAEEEAELVAVTGGMERVTPADWQVDCANAMASEGLSA